MQSSAIGSLARALEKAAFLRTAVKGTSKAKSSKRTDHHWHSVESVNEVIFDLKARVLMSLVGAANKYEALRPGLI